MKILCIIYLVLQIKISIFSSKMVEKDERLLVQYVFGRSISGLDQLFCIVMVKPIEYSPTLKDLYLMVSIQPAFTTNLGFVITTMLPTIAGNILGYSTIFFGDKSFEAAIGVNLTIMLVITTM